MKIMKVIYLLIREKIIQNRNILGTLTYYPNIHALKNVCRIAKLSSNDIQFKIIGKIPLKWIIQIMSL